MESTAALHNAEAVTNYSRVYIENLLAVSTYFNSPGAVYERYLAANPERTGKPGWLPLDGTEYKWRVQAGNSFGWSSSSASGI